MALFVLSFVSLFLELAPIRWLASYVPYLGFFTNLMLVALALYVLSTVAPGRYAAAVGEGA